MKRINKVFLVYILCVTALFLFATFVLGGVLKFYQTIPYFDKSLHLLSAGLITSVFGFWLAGKMRLQPFFAALFAFCFAVSIGVLFEILEFASDSIFTTNHQHWIATTVDKFGFLGVKKQDNGLIDTMGDIVANTVGAAIACTVGWMWLKFQKNKQISNSDKKY